MGLAVKDITRVCELVKKVRPGPLRSITKGNSQHVLDAGGMRGWVYTFSLWLA